ncbi:Na(+), Li(+), K(+)/H(+) antiporter [Bacillus rhizoplanae]|uniref:Na(+), Li(+), K(+)/H(+) antiporter n=1 Tax=Bacillus rhizoplanae TaxID=2880966 RepID=A0ABN8A376_9BACI|nr:MFS transporter [Bacillus rhizoplanae]CAG9614310.1 Na(+), Li(+), K(+)/H(+) antiporter [Bacillus rhizoplanae]
MILREWDSNLRIRLVGEWLFGLFFWMLLPFMAIYFAEELGKTMAGILLVLSQVLSVFANLVGGYLADTYGRKRMMVIAAFAQSAAFVLFAFANSPWLQSPILTFVAFSIIGIMGSLYYPASAAMVADLVSEEQQSKVFAVFYTMININVVLGPILGAYFFFSHRFELLIASVVINFIVAFVLLKFIKETLPEKRKEVEKQTGWLTVVNEQIKNYRIIFQDRVFLLFIIAGILVAQTFTQLDLLLAVYIKENVPTQEFFQLTLNGEKLFSWIIAENGFLVALFTVYVTRLANYFSERTIFLLSSFAYGIAMVIFPHTISVWGLIIAMLIFTFGELLVVGIQNSFVSKLAPEHMRGQYFAAATLRWSIGRTIAPIAIPLTAWIGYQYTFYIIAVLAFLSAFLYSVMFQFLQGRKIQVKKAMNE